MLDRTLLWVAARDEKKIPVGLADCYAKSLVQLLTEPESVKLPERQRPSGPGAGRQVLVLHSSEGEDLRPGVRPKDQGPYTRLLFFCRLDEAAVNNFLYHYAQARHQGELQDREFYNNPNKKAAMRDMRQGRDHHNGKKESCDLCIMRQLTSLLSTQTLFGLVTQFSPTRERKIA